ncbi:MAG: diguanylate cyclase [Candidatus Cloacimonetes bacterium]|nr:diguanylate cyclase [Candidatus Cloacimonadota bacterium]
MKQPKKRILLVDDDCNVLCSLRRNLLTEYDITSRNDPREAIKLVEQGESFSVIVSDYQMPFIDGISFFEQIQQLAPDTVRIMLTGHADLNMALEAVNRGNIFRFLLKPSKIDQLRATIAEAVARHDEIQCLQHRSTTDALSGLLNRGTIMQRLYEEVQRAQRYSHSLSVALFDLDHFKRINDTWGHIAGDKVLRRTSEVMMEHARETDICGRYGGEEFLLLLPDTALEQAQVLAERIRVELENTVFEQTDLHLTLSGGISQYDGQSCAELVHAADLLLYKAKDAGRNRVEV